MIGYTISLIGFILGTLSVAFTILYIKNSKKK